MAANQCVASLPAIRVHAAIAHPLQSAHGRPLTDDIGQENVVAHPYNQKECMLLLPTLLTSADGSIVVDDVGRHMSVSHPKEPVECMLPSPPFSQALMAT